MQAIDLEPEEPVLRSGHKHDRRLHISRVLLLILQVVNSELAAKQNSSETSRQAVSFVAQHSRMMQRVLREASIGNLNGWEPGEREAELATLVLALVTRLNFSQLSQQPGAPAGLLFQTLNAKPHAGRRRHVSALSCHKHSPDHFQLFVCHKNRTDGDHSLCHQDRMLDKFSRPSLIRNAAIIGSGFS